MTAEPFPALERYRELVDDWDAFVAALAAPLPRSVAANGARVDPGRLRTLLAPALARVEPIPWFPRAYRLDPQDRPGLHWGYSAGLYTIQEEASLLPVRLLDAQPGERVLDLCAAPGNKAAQIALALGPRGTLVANDIAVGRIAALHDVCRRLGLVNVTATARDGATWPEPDGCYDRVLVDAPCTAEGNTRKGVRRASSERFRRWVSGQQRALLERALALCRPGGRVVYATCTFSPDENEAIVDDVLRRLSGTVRVRAVSLAELPADPGVAAWAGRRFDPALRHAVRLWPHRANTGGFFAVALDRDGDAPRVDVDAPLPEAISAAEAAAYVEHFALPAGALDGLRFFRTSRHVRAVAAAHRPPAAVQPVNLGLDFARLGSAHPKVTTAAAMAFCQGARRNRIALDARELEAWRRREPLTLAAARIEGCEPGYQLVEHAGFVVGTGFLRPAAGGGRLESHFPKAWMRYR